MPAPKIAARRTRAFPRLFGFLLSHRRPLTDTEEMLACEAALKFVRLQAEAVASSAAHYVSEGEDTPGCNSSGHECGNHTFIYLMINEKSDCIGRTACRHPGYLKLGGMIVRWRQHQQDLWKHADGRANNRRSRYGKLLEDKSDLLLSCIAMWGTGAGEAQARESYCILEAKPTANNLLRTPGIERRIKHQSARRNSNASCNRGRPFQSQRERKFRLEPATIRPNEDALDYRKFIKMQKGTANAFNAEKRKRELGTQLQETFSTMYTRARTAWPTANSQLQGPLEIYVLPSVAVLRYALEKKGHFDWHRLLDIRGWPLDRLCYFWTLCEIIISPVVRGTFRSSIATFCSGLGMQIKSRYTVLIIDSICQAGVRKHTANSLRSWRTLFPLWTRHICERLTYVQKKSPHFEKIAKHMQQVLRTVSFHSSTNLSEEVIHMAENASGIERIPYPATLHVPQSYQEASKAQQHECNSWASNLGGGASSSKRKSIKM